MLVNEAFEASKVLFGREPTGTTALGGSSRESVRVSFGDHSVIATKRKKTGRAELEAIVLRELNIGGGPVPKLLHFDKEWLIQEDLGDIRLSVALSKADKATGKALLSRCVEGLGNIHRLGAERQLNKIAPVIGEKSSWLESFVELPEKLGDLLEGQAPELNKPRLVELLGIHEPCFIKWDNRPGNIIISNDGTPRWIDWEHCGIRNGLDDIAWLLCDEYVPDWPDVENDLIKNSVVGNFGNLSETETQNYLRVFGVFHICQRLSLIISKKGDGNWWNPNECLLNDRVGVFEVAVIRSCQRAKRWANESELTAPLSPWFDKILQKIF